MTNLLVSGVCVYVHDNRYPMLPSRSNIYTQLVGAMHVSCIIFMQLLYIICIDRNLKFVAIYFAIVEPTNLYIRIGYTASLA